MKGNQVHIQKFERPNKTSVKNVCPQVTWKLNEAIFPKIWIESKQIKTNENQLFFLSFYI